MDLVTGMVGVGLAIGLVINLLLFLPGVLAALSYSQAKKEGR